MAKLRLPKNPAVRIFLVLCVIAVLTVPLVFADLFLTYWRYQPQEGDLIFQSLPSSEVVKMIEGVSQSRYSHCGIVAWKNGEWVVIEAIGPVKETPLFEWIYRGREFDFDVYRIDAETEVLTMMIAKARGYMGRPYDIKYAMDDEKIYCSELIFKAYRDATGEALGKPQPLGKLNWKPYEKTIRKIEEGDPPLERMIITPAAITQSEKVSQAFGK